MLLATNDCNDDDNHGDGGHGDVPSDLFTNEERKNGAVILHLLCMFYIFIGISNICNFYFEPSLTIISEYLNLSADVAGATFMRSWFIST